MKRLMQMTATTLLAGAMLAAAVPCNAQANWAVEKSLHVGGEGGWDYVTVDAAHHRLFVTRSTHTQVLDETSGKVLADIPGQIRSHGVALVPKLHRGFITDGGGSGSIVVFDTNSYQVLGKLATVPDSDGIIYDEAQDRVLAVSGDKGVLMSFRPDINPKSGKVDTMIPLGGSPEFLATDGSGKVYVNIEDKDVVAEVDLHTNKVIARWPVTPGGHPVGLAIDAATHRLFIGCRNPRKMVIMSTDDGRVLGSVPIGAGVDATGFEDGESFASCGDGSLVVVKGSGTNYSVAQTVKTPNGARTMAIDPTSQAIYLPTSEFEPMAAGATGRPKMKPNTFMVVEVNRK